MTGLINAQTYNGLNAHAGMSWVNGNLGLEYQVSHFAVSTGWATGRIPLGKRINSYSGALTYYYKDWNESGVYSTIGYATQGFTGQTFYNPHFNETSPSIIVLTGCRVIFNNFYIKSGLGANLNKFKNRIEFEFVIGYTIFHNMKKKYSQYN